MRGRREMKRVGRIRLPVADGRGNVARARQGDCESWQQSTLLAPKGARRIISLPRGLLFGRFYRG